jgi:hypothetical protein
MGRARRHTDPLCRTTAGCGAVRHPAAPVLLRKGERELGGALSWIEPQPLAAYPSTRPFAGLPTPRDIAIRRQVLAEPSADLAARTWASLADGTPLVTASERGSGRIVLFHVTAEASWSNLPISGHFVDMLRRVVQLSRAVSGGGEAGSGILPPWRLLDANAALLPASGDAKPLDLTGGSVVRAAPTIHRACMEARTASSRSTCLTPEKRLLR